MKPKGILMSTAMIQAYMKGLKTETRRLKNLGKINKDPDEWKFIDYGADFYWFESTDRKLLALKCPYGDAGDELVFREAFCDGCPEGQNICYKAGRSLQPAADFCEPKWRPSIHMPFEYARFKTKLLARPIPQRLHDMKPENYIAEGYKALYLTGKDGNPFEASIDEFWFGELWNSLNAKRGYPWSMNPWCWRLSFERYEGR